MNTSDTYAGLIKDGAYCLSALPIFEGLHSLTLLTSIMPLLESKAVAALITGMLICGARLLETRLSNRWRQRALSAEEKLAQLRPRTCAVKH